MKTIRLLYPDHLSGNVSTYYFGANLLAHILPANEAQPLLRVDISAPDGAAHETTDGIYAKDEVLAGIHSAQRVIAEASPDKIITIGGNCLVSLAPFDYLHGLYPNTGIVWLDAHPDVSTPADGYPNAHAMVLGALLGGGAPSLAAEVKAPKFRGSDVLYVGLQGVFDYQAAYLKEAGVDYRLQAESFLSLAEIRAFASRFDHLLIHLDIDVLDASLFHSTWFANPELQGDGSGGGRMTMQELSKILQCLAASSDIVGLTIAEYMPFDEERLHNMLAGLKLFSE